MALATSASTSSCCSLVALPEATLSKCSFGSTISARVERVTGCAPLRLPNPRALLAQAPFPPLTRADVA